MSAGAPAPSQDDDAGLRRRLVLIGRATFATALAALLAGLVVVAREPASPDGAAGTRASGAEPAAPVPTVAQVSLSTGGTSASPVIWQVRAGRDASRNAALAGYQAYLGTTVRLSEEPDPDDVALSQVALDPQLGLLRRVLASSAASGASRRGRVVATARVVGLRGDQAVMVGCVNTAAQHLFGSDRRPVARWRGGLSVSDVRLRRSDGRWKVYRVAAMPATRCRR